MALRTCELCREVAQLRDSHVIPSFVYRWLKETSASGYLRTQNMPNKRTQQGWVREMLCPVCEQRLSGWEKQFAETVFLPTTEGRWPLSDTYEPWLFDFAVSVSWRALRSMRSDGELDRLEPAALDEIDDALEVLRQFLLGRRFSTGRFEQHMLLGGLIASTSSASTPANMNRYLTRAVDCVASCNPKTTFIYVNMCGILLLGFIEIFHRKQWKGTRLSPKGGRLSRQYSMPGDVELFLQRRARSVRGSLNEMSARQREKLEQYVLANPEVVARSGSFQAMARDVELFGKDAFDE